MRRALVTAVVATALTVFVIGTPPASAAPAHDSLQAGWFGSTTSFTDGHAKVTVPAITCPASVTADYAIAVEWTGGFLNLASVSVVIHCENGVASTTATAYEFTAAGTNIKQFDVAPGDVVSATFSYDSGTGLIKVVGRDVTTGAHKTATQTLADQTWTGASYYFRRLDPSSPVFTFTTIPFSNVTIDGQAAAMALDGGLSAKNLYNGSHKLVQAGPLNVAGNGFKLKFVNEL